MTCIPCAAGSQTEGYRITQQFIEDMLEAFRDQKKIHLRFAFEIVMGALAALKSEATLVDVDIPEGGCDCSHVVAHAAHTMCRPEKHVFAVGKRSCLQL